MNLRLTELEPRFLKRINDDRFRHDVAFADADGVMFVCPLCFLNNGKKRAGVHSVICWNPSVPQTTEPTPGRWNLLGTGFDDLTLQAGSSSILLTGDGCGWHGFIRNGEVTNA
jgi:hypothetical protein